MKLNAFTLTLAPLLVAGAFSAHAGPQAHVVCAYHHTLGDDAIMMFGKPNQAMWHDFFGNTHTDAVSTYQTLRDQPETTCDNKADWAGTTFRQEHDHCRAHQYGSRCQCINEPQYNT